MLSTLTKRQAVTTYRSFSRGACLSSQSSSIPNRGAAAPCDRRRHMTFKSLRVSTLGLAGVVAMAATAGPAVAADFVNPVPTFIPVPPDQANVQPGGAFTSFDISF